LQAIGLCADLADALQWPGGGSAHHLGPRIGFARTHARNRRQRELSEGQRICPSSLSKAKYFFQGDLARTNFSRGEFSKAIFPESFFRDFVQGDFSGIIFS
jgi:hypothetical protein